MRIAAFVLVSCVAVGLQPIRSHAGDESGEAAFHRGDLTAARASWLPLAEQGNRRAQFYVGRTLLVDGDRKGVTWVKKSAEAGYLPAELCMAKFTVGGLYVPLDIAAAHSWLKKAAGHDVADMRAHPLEGGTARAILAEAEAEAYAQDDFAKAMQYLRQAADAGDAETQLNYVMNLERLIDAESADQSAKAKDPRIAIVHAYAVISGSQEANVGGFLFTPGHIADRLEEQMSEAQLARSNALVREWHAAREAGTLGWLYNQHKRQPSLGERAFTVLQTMESGMDVLRPELMQEQCAPNQVPWLSSRTPVEPWAPEKTTWEDRWEIHGCGAPHLMRATFETRGGAILWTFKAWIDVHGEVREARAEAQALLERGEPEKAHAIWMRLAAEGDGASEVALGRLYEQGLGVERDIPTAYAWYVLAHKLRSVGAGRLALALREQTTQADLEEARQRIRAWLDPPGEREPVALFPITRDGKVGYMDRTGRVVVDPQYDGYVDPRHVGEPREWMFSDYAVLRAALVPVLRHGWWGFVDDQGQVVVSPRYEEVGSFHEGRVAVRERKKRGYLNRRGTLVLGMRFDEASRFREGLARVRVGDEVGVIDTHGRMVVPLGRFDDVRQPSEGVLVVSRGGKHGYLDVQTGKMIAEPRFVWAGPFEGGRAQVRIDDRVAVVDREGRITELPEVRGLKVTDRLTDTLHVIQRGDHYGIYDVRAERVVVEPRFSRIGVPKDGLILVEVGAQKGYLDLTGAEVIPPLYRTLGPFSEGLAAAGKELRVCGYLDRSGARVIPPSFLEASRFQHGLAVARRTGSGPYIYIDRNGKMVFSFPQEE